MDELKTMEREQKYGQAGRDRDGPIGDTDGEPWSAQLVQGTAPLVVWGVHFFFSYGCVAAACLRGGGGSGTLIAISLLALGVEAVMLKLALRHWQAQGGQDAGLLAWARAGSALLGVIGVLWSSMPILMLDPCA